MSIDESFVGTADDVEMSDRFDMVMTERYLLGGEPWPLFMTLPLKRLAYGGKGYDAHEAGWCQRDRYGEIEPVVFMQGDGPVRSARYASVAQLVAAGWRVD